MERVLAAVLLGLAGACAVGALVPSIPPDAGPAPGNAATVRSESRGSERRDSERWDSERRDSERSGSERRGSERRGSERGGSERGASERSGPGSREPGSDGPGSPEAGDLLFEVVERDLGRLEAGARAAVEFPWRWSGPGDLRVLALETDCGCAVASGLPDVVPEGARGTFVLDMKGRSRPGPFDHVVRLRVDRAPDAVLRLRVRGFVGSAVAVDPPELDLGRLSVGRSVVRVVTVRPPPPSGDRPREDGRMRASLLEDRRPADRRVEARLVGLEGTCEVRGTARPGVDGADVLVRAQVPERAGPFHGHVEVRVAGEGVWRLPLRGEAVDGGASVPAAPRTAGAPVPAGEAGTGPERRPR